MMRVAPSKVPRDLLRVRVQEQLVVVESETLGGIERAMYPISVQEPGAGLGKVTVPDLVGLLGERYPMEFPPAGGIEQAEFDLFGMLRKDRKIYTFSIPGRPQRVRFPGPYDGIGLRE